MGWNRDINHAECAGTEDLHLCIENRRNYSSPAPGRQNQYGVNGAAILPVQQKGSRAMAVPIRTLQPSREMLG